MYSGLLPKGLTEEELSTDEEEQETAGERREDDECEASATNFCSAGENTSSAVETQPTHTNSDSPTCSMPGISQEMWQVCGLGLKGDELVISQL